VDDEDEEGDNDYEAEYFDNGEGDDYDDLGGGGGGGDGDGESISSARQYDSKHTDVIVSLLQMVELWIRLTWRREPRNLRYPIVATVSDRKSVV